MILLVQASGALFGMLAVLFGAFGAHHLKRTLTPERLSSFETGVKYQFYHALLLLVLGFNFGFTTALETWIAYCIIVGTVLFSFSIYLLCLLAKGGRQLKVIGMLTPLGGLFLISGWGLLLYSFFQNLV
jgi:uncharacterized membrane protein YgdD (TMEM256/DUF423 family)